MTYIPALDKLQLYSEAAFMTPQNTDIQPAGLEIKITPQVETVQIPTKGSTMPAKYSYVTRRWATGNISGPLDYNRAMLWLDGMFGYDASSPHTYISDEDAAVVPRGITAVFGQTGLIYQIAGIVPTNLKISGSNNGPWMFDYGFFSLPVTDGATLQALTEDVPEFVHGYETTLYLDEDLDATMGTTARADIAFTFEANITADHAPVWHMGDQAWDSVRQGKWSGSYKLVVEADATALDTLGDILDAANTGKGLTIRQTATDGTNTLELDFAGVCLIPPVIPTAIDGVVTIEFDMVPQWNSDYDGCWGADLIIA